MAHRGRRATWWCSRDRRRECVRWKHGGAVLGLDPVSRAAEEPREASVSGDRSQRDLCAHRGNVHAFHAWCTSRRLGLDSVRCCLGAGRSWSYAEVAKWDPVPSALDHAVCGHGLACADRDSTPLASRARGRLAVAHRRRPRVHIWHRLLCGGTRAVRPFRVARLRPDGNSVSLLCSVVVLRLTGGVLQRSDRRRWARYGFGSSTAPTRSPSCCGVKSFPSTVAARRPSRSTTAVCSEWVIKPSSAQY